MPHQDARDGEQLQLACGQRQASTAHVCVQAFQEIEEIHQADRLQRLTIR